MNALLLALGFIGALPVHDFFVSILTIRHNAGTHTLDLTWRMTAHDIEHALENVGKLKLASEHEHPKADSILFAYVSEHLDLRIHDRILCTTWLGRELDGETLYCFLQVNDMDSLGPLTVSNTLLQDLFYEQQNLVHIERNAHPTESHMFLQGAAAHTFTW